MLSALLECRTDPKALQLQFVTKLAYVWGFVTVKMSFAVLYLRLLPGHVSRRINQVLLAVLAAEGVEATMVVVFHCKPIDKAWNIQKEGTCLNLKLFYYVSVSPTTGADYKLICLQRPSLVRYQVRHRRLPLHPAHSGRLEASTVEGEEARCDPDAFDRFVVSKSLTHILLPWPADLCV